MDQTLELKPGNRRLAVERLRDFIATSVDAAPSFDTPFTHLVFDRVFPDDIYAAMLANMPEAIGLPADARPQQRPRSRRRHPHAGEDRSVSGIYPPPAAAEARGLGHCRPRVVLAAGARRLRAAAGAGARTPLRRRLRQDRHVSDPDPDPRHSRLSDHAAYRHALEGHHRAALSAARPLERRISARSSTRSLPTARCRRRSR